MKISNSIQTDFEHYKDYVQNREHLFEREEFLQVSDIYHELYIFSESISKYDGMDDKSRINYFITECKNALIISFDLLNMNYLNSSKQILRSSIESFFRFSLSLMRYIEYKENCSKGYYGATESLKKLNTLYSSHKVFNLTNGTIEYFKETIVNDCINNLYMNYSKLSSNVHITDTKEFSPQKYLLEYAKLNIADSIEACELYNVVLNNYILVLIYFDKLLEVPSLTKKRIQFLEYQLDEKEKGILTELENFLKM
ncbi:MULTISPECIES: hypothetical protein [Enterococcus]|uniref:hypothetical protein n=1 Tax=Enterococcus TaxID=1350 RepID=UPI0008D2202D|nr:MULTISPECIES: hypothetical protein [Enterococcus]MDN6775994.1 hypothetical protein [Enterococcus sp.]MDU5509592.1 hypothetical protein [Enterococcus gilvus]SET83939.1 hypothetical protein SAMN04487821_12481 [Enterococcus malodoratus]